MFYNSLSAVNCECNMLYTLQGGEDCQICLPVESFQAPSIIQDMIRTQNLNQSQEEAVLRCVSMINCRHNNTKLIWGPPGTGKTKTVGCLLFSLLKLKARTLTCAPTNTAVLEVAARLHSLVRGSNLHRTYGMGDIVLFGNRSRMKMDSYQGLGDLFLDSRVKGLMKYLSASTGWHQIFESLIQLLEGPRKQYLLYEKEIGLMSLEEFAMTEDTNMDFAYRAYKRSMSYDVSVTFEEFVQRKRKELPEKYKSDQDAKKKSMMTMEDFVKRKFRECSENLSLFMNTLQTHLPTSVISHGTVKQMFRVQDLLSSLKISLSQVKFMPNHNDSDEESILLCLGWTGFKINECLSLLNSLPKSISLPEFKWRVEAEKFCLSNACIILCTASSSIKLYSEGFSSVQFLVIDEAAQLKECESAIPLQLPGLNHCILIGDEKQLPALVKSRVST